MKRSSSLLVGVDAEVILEEVVMEEQHHHQVDSLFWSLWLGVLELSCAGGSPTFIFKKTVISIHCEISHSCCD